MLASTRDKTRQDRTVPDVTRNVAIRALFDVTSNKMYNIALMFTFALLDIIPAQYNCKPRDCYDLKCFRVSKAKDGPHTIYPDKSTLTSLQVYCDQDTDSGGWIIYQRRVDGSLNFTRSWQDYKDGFGTNGDGTTELWLGNENVYQMVQSYGYLKGELRIEADAFDGTHCWLVASDFRMYPEGRRYKMDWGRVTESHSGIALNWNFHEVLTFKTHDNVDGQAQCLREYKGGWWYGHVNDCVQIFLNGVYVKQADSTSTSIAVRSFKPNTALQRSRMMFRRTKDLPCLNPCKNGGTCDHVASPKGIRNRCRCTSQFCGETCEIVNPCRNNGTCKYNTTTNSTSCTCATGFSGPICEDATSEDATSDNTIIALVVGLVLLLILIAAGVCIAVISSRRRNEKKRREQQTFQLSQLAELEDFMGGFFSFFGMNE